jgi:hypothetical protein
MYVCHICGKDNTMKDGGWLDKYNDGGPVQPNYNDYSVSAPEGFEGDGYSNVGRNYSPAWGGQFQMGGSVYPVNYVPKAQNGWLEKLESKVEGFMGKPMDRGTTYAHDDIKNKKSNELDTLRHAYTAMETSDAIKKATGNIPFISDQLAFVGTNALGAGHELTHLFKSTPDELRESGEDVINNFAGSLAGLVPFVNDDTKRKAIQYLSNEGILPDGTTAGRGRTYNIVNKKYAMGGSMPGAVGFTYARTGDIPSNGPYAKKTMASAQNGTWLDKAINKAYESEDKLSEQLGNPMKKATNIAKEASYKHLGSMDDPIDSYRHSMAGNYTSEAIQDKLYNIPLVSQAAGFVGANLLGAGHELSTLIGHAPEFGGDDDRPWLDKIKESGEDVFNNMVGAGVGSIPFMSAKQKSDLLLNMSLNNRLPDGHGQGNMYIKKKQNGGEMKYYQEGLDFQPKTISRNGSVIKDDMGQWAHPGEITEIGSNQITMQGVPYPVLGISDTGDTQMMYPNQEYQYEGSSVTEYPMMAAGGVVEDPKKKKSSMINLGDLTMTPEELEYVNASNSGYCPGGNCLENTRKGYDMTAGRIPGIPSSGDIWTKDLQLISTASTPSEKLVKENPYFRGDTSFGSADSWDIHGAIVKAGGKNIYSQAKGQVIPKDIAIGSMVGYGPAGTRESSHSNRNQGMNKDYGYQPSHHSTQVVSYSVTGEPVVYDSYLNKYGPLSQIAKELKSSLGYEIENISVPKSVAGNTRENLAKKGLLNNELTEYSPDINKLIGGTKQGWAQIKEDGKMRSPKVDNDALGEFARALSKNKGELVSSLRLSNADYDRLANTALALAMTESEGGGALGFSDRFGSTQGMTQLNVDNIKNDARLKSALGKNYKSKVSVTNLLSPGSSAVATMMYLSVAEKDAKRLYNKGLKAGVKTFNQPGFIENFRASNSRLNKDGVFIDELNKRIPYSEIPGYDDEDVTQVNNYLKKLTKSDKYNFVNKDGDLSLKMKTKGNNPKLTDIEKIAYMWQSPNSLKTGDAEGKSEYVNKIKNYYNLLTAKKMEQGGQLTKLDQLTNFTNYNTKQPGGWLDKYSN